MDERISRMQMRPKNVDERINTIPKEEKGNTQKKKKRIPANIGIQCST